MKEKTGCFKFGINNFSAFKKSSFLNFPIQWYLNILNYLNILMMLNKILIQWFWADVTIQSLKFFYHTVFLLFYKFLRLAWERYNLKM